MARDESLFGTDLRLRFTADADLSLSGTGDDLELVSGLDNLSQALTLRLLVPQGALARLAHPRYGSRVHELIGEPLDRPNLDLLRRHVRKALLQDPRVAEVRRVAVTPREDAPGVLEVVAVVAPVSGGELRVEVALDVG